MLAAPLLRAVEAPRPRLRSCRRPFAPAVDPGPYQLPRAVAERLAVDLAPYRNRDAALTLARLLARHWSTPSRLPFAFPIDRRALAALSGIGLTEARVRGAIRVLAEVGFIEAELPEGSRYRPTADGLQRRPLFWRFAPDYGEAFNAANVRARKAAARAGKAPERRPLVDPRRQAQKIKSPKSTGGTSSSLLMGELVDANLNAARSSTLPKLSAAALKGFRHGRSGFHSR